VNDTDTIQAISEPRNGEAGRGCAPALGSASRSKFKTIVADPPWPIDKIAAMPRVSEGWIDPRKKTSRGEYSRGKTERGGKLDYKTMSLADIAAVPVRELADDGCHLYLWTINRHLEATYDIARAWGFKPCQLLTWGKKPRGICLGTFTSTTEFVLFCRRGTLKATRRIDTTWWNWPRSNKHSAKPEVFIDMVESVSPGPYLELFARRNRLGWATWGNEALCHVELVTPNIRI
jgi:N6-adenosine-specific RNA methylase IME4